MKKIVAILAMALLLSAIVVPAAQANPFVGAATCGVTLQTWPGSGTAECTGSAAGVDVGAGIVCAPLCSFRARVDSYGEECLAGEPPLIGTAAGELFVDGTSIGNFNWLRVGLTAVLVPPDAAGVAAFAPTTLPPPTCAAPGTLQALVVGVAAAI